MKYMHIEKAVMIPGTTRELYFICNNSLGQCGLMFGFNPPFSHRGFELEFKILWIGFGIRWNIPF